MTKVLKLMGSWEAVCGLFLAGLVLTGCGSLGGSRQKYSDVSSSQASAVAHTPVAAEAPTHALIGFDKIKVGDSLTITYADLPTAVQPFDGQVKEDGTITLIQNQVFQVAGKSLRELEGEIQARYVPSIYRNLTATVKKTPQTQFYYVGGDVRSPGRQVYISRITVTKAIQSAGDFTDFAKKSKVVLTREDGRKFTIDVPKALKDAKLDLEVFPGDSINVPRRAW
jgi:polysaccharide export outer membrane protein